MQKQVIVSVINDLYTDQRVHKVCTTLTEMGFDVLLVGRRQRSSLALSPRIYQTKRMFLLFEKGPLFYAEFNLRLFLFLLFKKTYLLVSNDLDTLLPNYLISKVKKCYLVYDSHEYFTGVPELINRPRIQKIWKRIEKAILPKIVDGFTVNNSIAKLYYEEYGIKLNVLRNVPNRINIAAKKTRHELGLPTNKKILILQGSGINVSRGTEEAVLAMKYIEEVIFLIIGSGDVIQELKNIVKDNNLEKKVLFIGKLPYTEMLQYTINADLGLTLDKDTNINYRFSLPNKLFDYIQAGIPVLASNLIEIKSIIEEYNVGTTIDNHVPENISKKIKEIFLNEVQYKIWKENCIIAAQKLCWEQEKLILENVYRKYL